MEWVSQVKTCPYSLWLGYVLLLLYYAADSYVRYMYGKPPVRIHIPPVVPISYSFHALFTNF